VDGMELFGATSTIAKEIVRITARTISITSITCSIILIHTTCLVSLALAGIVVIVIVVEIFKYKGKVSKEKRSSGRMRDNTW
jgi:quinol-cytochrome oxidoreductase complex cytochrome b subunit